MDTLSKDKKYPLKKQNESGKIKKKTHVIYYHCLIFICENMVQRSSLDFFFFARIKFVEILVKPSSLDLWR